MRYAFALILAAAMAVFYVTAATADHHVRIYKTQGDFAEVKQDVEDAIINKGFVIDYHGDIAKMLSRTAKDVGAKSTVYAGASLMQFCSARVSRKAMEVDPANIAFCPYVVFMYATSGDPKTVHVGYRRPEGGKGMEAVDTLLDSIVKDAVGQ